MDVILMTFSTSFQSFYIDNFFKIRCIAGYRIYLNSQAKGMVNGSKTKAMLEGLDPEVTYRSE